MEKHNYFMRRWRRLSHPHHEGFSRSFTLDNILFLEKIAEGQCGHGDIKQGCLVAASIRDDKFLQMSVG